jgi:hypothetical protein
MFEMESVPIWRGSWASGGAATTRMARPSSVDEVVYGGGSVCLPDVRAALAVQACAAQKRVGGRLG